MSFSEHKGNVSLGGSEVVKGIYKNCGNLKWVAWGLDVGTGTGRTSINWVCKFSLPLSHLHYCNLIFSGAFKEALVKLFIASSSAY